jgi:hypothetical protein
MIGRFFERFAPLVLSLAALATIYYFREEVAAHFAPDGWKAESLYSAVFNWASVQSGFVFGIYGFIVSKRNGFIGEIAHTHSFAELTRYARRAYLSGFVLTFASLPLTVIQPTITDPNSSAFMVAAVWFAAFIWTFFAFLRVAFIFGALVAVPDRRERIPG